MMRPGYVLVLLIAALLLAGPQPAAAYIGPGAGISAIGTLVAFFFAVILAVVGFLWYPAKRLLAKSKKTGKVEADPPPQP